MHRDEVNQGEPDKRPSRSLGKFPTRMLKTGYDFVDFISLQDIKSAVF